MEKFKIYLNEARRHLNIADHMVFVTYPLVNEKRILLKIFDEIFKVVDNCVQAALSYEFFLNKSPISNDKESLATFLKKYSILYGLNKEQINILSKIYNLNDNHNLSAIEFVRKDKMVIMSDSLGLDILDIDKINEYLAFSKEFLIKVNIHISNSLE